MKTLHTTCCIAGGGPAGLMLGYLLARAGVKVTVLEQYPDFFRDFRGDTIHPSTLELMHELGVLQRFLKRPHQKASRLRGYVGNTMLTIADFTRLPVQCPYIAFMPQWEFLDFIAGEARQYPGFTLLTNSKVSGLMRRGGHVVGVRAQTPKGALGIHATLVVGADGRHSTVREQAGFKVAELGAPMDVFWLKLPRKNTDPDDTLGRFGAGHVMALINRDSYWQCAYVIPKGGAGQTRARGLPAFRRQIGQLAPFLANRTRQLKSWDEVKLLSVAVDRLPCWHQPGLLCIGDSAHAMSPIGGVGVNLAVQDAVAAANLLAAPLLAGTLTRADLARVQRRRMLPARLTQRLQVFIQNRVIAPTLAQRASSTRPGTKLPWPLRLLQRFPVLARIPARVIGLGFRPEHIRT